MNESSAGHEEAFEGEQLAKSHVRRCLAQLGLPTRAESFSELRTEALLTIATRLQASSSSIANLQELSDSELRYSVRRNFLRVKSAAVTAYLDGGNVLSLHDMQSLLSWKDSTSKSATNTQPTNGSLDDTSFNSSALGPPSVSSEPAAPHSIHSILDEFHRMKSRLAILEEERQYAPDDDDDRTAGGRRLALLPAVRSLLP